MNQEDRKIGKDEAYFILRDIKDDIKDLNHQLHQATVDATQREATLNSLTSMVNDLDKHLTKGLDNGTASIITQIAEMKSDIVTMKADMASLKDAHKKELEIQETSPKQVRVERIKLAAKIFAFLTVLAVEIAGILSAIHGVQS